MITNDSWNDRKKPCPTNRKLLAVFNAGDNRRITLVVILEPMVRDRVVRMLEIVAEAPRDRIILLCYEKPSSFCHRHLVAEWLGDCKEFGGNPAVKVGDFVIHKKILQVIYRFPTIFVIFSHRLSSAVMLYPP